MTEMLGAGTPVLVSGGQAEIQGGESVFYKTFGGRVLDHNPIGLLLEDDDWGVCLVPWPRIMLVKVDTERGSSDG